jgi:hypothetical protein
MDDYLAARDLIMYWLRRPGFSSARSDGALVTDSANALASQFWEGQLRTALKDGPARFLFENTGSTFYDKGFEMLQVLEDNFCPSSISNTFTTLLSLFNDRQSDKEGIHKFRSRFEGHFSALSRSSVAIPPILQVMLVLRALHLRYQDLLNQFASKQKYFSVATIDSVVADAKFMDEFVAVGANGKAASPSPFLRSPAAATALTDREGKEHRSPWESLASYDSPGILSRWRRSLRGGFYCAFCHSKEKHHPLKAGISMIRIGAHRHTPLCQGDQGLGILWLLGVDDCDSERWRWAGEDWEVGIQWMRVGARRHTPLSQGDQELRIPLLLRVDDCNFQQWTGGD